MILAIAMLIMLGLGFLVGWMAGRGSNTPLFPEHSAYSPLPKIDIERQRVETLVVACSRHPFEREKLQHALNEKLKPYIRYSQGEWNIMQAELNICVKETP